MPHHRSGVPSSLKNKNLPSARFNLGTVVEKTVYAHCVKSFALQKGVKETVIFFEGLLAGYNDWFSILNITQDIFDTIQEKLNKEEIVKRAEKFVNDIIEEKSRKLVLLSDRDGLELAKKTFDQKLKIGG